MRRTRFTLLLALAPVAVMAQGPPAPGAQSLPREVRREVVDRWNGANDFRASNRAEIDATQDIRGNVSVLRGPLTIAGHVGGDVLVINGDIILLPTARIDGGVIVVGGDVEGRSVSRVDGPIRIYRQPLAFRIDGEQIAAIDAADEPRDDNWWQRFERHGSDNWTEALRVVQAGPYNRVEGLPIELGPALRRRTPWGSLQFNAAAIIRSGSTFESDRGDVGHKLHGEVRIGHDRGIGIGARAFNVVEPIETWQLSNLETALAAFLARRDYRDYYTRHGATGYVTLYGARDLNLTGAFSEEHWSSRAVHTPFSLFNDDHPWRSNPLIDEGLFHVADLALQFDTRTDPDDPWSGWYMNADIEHGRGIISSPGIHTDGRTLIAGDRSNYSRGLFDVRRYNRLGPKAQLNMRVVLGGWLGGDPMPLQRRLSVDGPGALPGYGFRAVHEGVDVGTCNNGVAGESVGMQAECDRIALAQVEYRGDLKLGFTGDWEDWPRRFHGERGDITWVVFADAGRGWKVGESGVGTDGVVYGNATLPRLSTFRSDLGVGLDLAGIGFYAAKSASAPSEPLNFFVRLRHRF